MKNRWSTMRGLVLQTDSKEMESAACPRRTLTPMEKEYPLFPEALASQRPANLNRHAAI
jgi:hypothetical protein